MTVIFSVEPTTPDAGTPTGNVTVSDGVNSCTTSVASGQCTLALTTIGNRTITATYTGDGGFEGSTSAGEPHTVTKAGSTTSITSDAPDPSVRGQAVTVAYTVALAGAGTGRPAT